MNIFNGIHYDFDENEAEVIYVYDALCGWCYGFSPVINKLFTEFSGQIDFLVLSGGMIRNDRVGPVSAIAPYIKSAYKDVEQLCGVKFGEKFIDVLLNDPDAIFSSVPAAKALAVMRLHKPAKSLDYASAIQHAIFYNGMHATDSEGLVDLAVKYGVDADEFMQKMNSKEIDEIVNHEFQLVENMDVSGYPTILLRKDNNMDVLARGYTTYEKLQIRLLQALEAS
jgi:putative protein-disulfide isomerase